MTLGDGPEADNALGLSLRGQGRLDEAAAAFGRAIAARPDDPAAITNLGTVFQLRGRLAEAAECYHRALAHNSGHADAHNALGMVLQAQGRLDDAIASYRRAVDSRPDHASAHSNLGAALQVAGEAEAAIACYRRAIELRPDHPEAHYNLGNVLHGLGRIEDAAAAYRRAIGLRPAYAEAHNNLGIALRDMGAPDLAAESYRRVLALRPDHAEAHYNLAMALLEMGDLAAGHEVYEWRFAAGAVPARDGTLPLWRGEPLRGRTLLVWGEQGYGDVIQFARYVPLLARAGAQVIFEVHEPLRGLMAGVPGVDVVLARGDALPPCDAQIPLMSLPRLFRTTLDTMPREVPYLHAPAAAIERWRKRLAGTDGLKIGLAWAGNPAQRNDRNRSMPLSACLPLLSAGGAGAAWFSLQVGEPAAQLTEIAAGNVVDLSPALTDFGETAAAMAALDLVVTVDTAVAHLAGALGRPAWVLLTFSPDWRWLRRREDNPWYPSARLFRQPRPGDWQAVAGRAAGELERLLAGDCSVLAP